MPQYKRCYIPGGTYFFTVNLENRNKSLLIDHFDLLVVAMRKVKESHPFQMNGWVVLPDHLHCIWTLPPNDNDYSGRWWKIKSLFTRAYRKSSNTQRARVWQQRFWEHCIRDSWDYEMHLNYIHINPVKHGYVNRVCEWPYSSFHRMVEKGRYSWDWAGESPYDTKHTFGE